MHVEYLSIQAEKLQKATKKAKARAVKHGTPKPVLLAQLLTYASRLALQADKASDFIEKVCSACSLI
jgi:hypothetical protein